MNIGEKCAKVNQDIKENEVAKKLAEDLGIDNPLMVSDQGPAPQAGDVGIVLSVNTSARKGTRKKPAEASRTTPMQAIGTDRSHSWQRSPSK